MSDSKPQGQRSGEGTGGLWTLIAEDDRRKNKEPHRPVRDADFAGDSPESQQGAPHDRSRGAP
jgi:hypothetical protein